MTTRGGMPLRRLVDSVQAFTNPHDYAGTPHPLRRRYTSDNTVMPAKLRQADRFKTARLYRLTPEKPSAAAVNKTRRLRRASAGTMTKSLGTVHLNKVRVPLTSECQPQNDNRSATRSLRRPFLGRLTSRLTARRAPPHCNSAGAVIVFLPNAPDRRRRSDWSRCLSIAPLVYPPQPSIGHVRRRGNGMEDIITGLECGCRSNARTTDQPARRLRPIHS